MIDTEKLLAVNHIIVHGGKCPDGRASAMILHDCMPTARIEFIQYESPELAALEPAEGQLFADFSPPKDRAKDFFEVGALVLDHHKGDKAKVQPFVDAGLGVFADEDTQPGKSGATLCADVWAQLQGRPNYIFKIITEFARLAGIRDTWQDKDPDFERACEQAAALRFWPEETLLETPVERWGDLMPLGKVLWGKHTKTIRKVADKALRWSSEAGTRCVAFQGTNLSSDIAEYLGDTVDFVVGFDIGPSATASADEFQLTLSTRSHTDFNCMNFCKHYKGGGHVRAAGVSVTAKVADAPNPYSAIQEMLDKYEAGLD